MSGIQRKEVLSLLSEILALSPDVRVGQVFAHLDFLSDAQCGKGLGYIDDDELLSVMYRHLAELQARAIKATAQTPLTGAA